MIGRRLLAGMVFAVLGLVTVCAPSVAEPLVGRPAPAFRLLTLDGRTLTNATFRGRTLVLNVWGSWCPPCRIETPDLAAEYRARGGRVAFVGVDTTESAAVVRAFTVEKSLPYPQVATSETSAFARAYGIRNYPSTFVIDPRGVLRAEHADNVLPRNQLRAYIDAAARGATAPLISDEQRKLDRLLDPAAYALRGDPATIAAGARAASNAIDRAESEMDDAMTDPARDHDLIATHALEERLRDAALRALASVATTPAQAALVARLRGDRAAASGAWRAAESAYAAALAIEPADRATLESAAYAASQRGDDARAAQIETRINALAPTYATEIAVARSRARIGDRAAARTALDRADALADAHATAARRAWTHLYAGRTAIEIGDRPRAAREFDAAAAAAAAIPRGNVRYAMYLEESQEARIALTLDRAAKPALSLAPWTGPELPGSILSTIKYRLALTARPRAQLVLAARGLPKGWIGSFCSDRLCSPFRTTIVIPADGVKIVEFQVVPGAPVPRPPVLTIVATRPGNVAVVATAAVRPN